MLQRERRIRAALPASFLILATGKHLHRHRRDRPHMGGVGNIKVAAGMRHHHLDQGVMTADPIELPA
jgi:hypothetical protein